MKYVTDGEIYGAFVPLPQFDYRFPYPVAWVTSGPFY